MQIVISDASPLFVLAHLGRFDLLSHFYSDVLVPPAVANELLIAPSPRKVVDVAELKFVRVVAPTNRATVLRLRQVLDPGESEAIALAIETPDAVLLIDERQGRERAKAEGLQITGILRLLVTARQARLIPSLTDTMQQLRAELNFRISPALFDQLRREAGEAPGR